MNLFFEELGAAFAAEAQRRGAAISPPQLEPKAAEELLELARVVAHTRERRFAPLACYLAGVAVARAQAQRPAIDVAELLKTVWLVYEPQEDSNNKTG